MKKKAVFNWSGGKDSALALYKILQSADYDIISLMTIIDIESKRSSSHGISVDLLAEQAASVGIPIYFAEYNQKEKNKAYEKCLLNAIEKFQNHRVDAFVFGDIFLPNAPSYHEDILNPLGIEVVKPLWKLTTDEVMEEFLQSGLKTVVTTTMSDFLDSSFIGRSIDREFVESLPDNVDVCGENGEYHTFCYDGPIFKYAVEFRLNEPVRFSNTFEMDDGTRKTFNYWITQPYKDN